MAFHAHLVASHNVVTLGSMDDRFSERLFPLESDMRKRFDVPRVTAIYDFLELLEEKLDIELSILIMALIYIERVLEFNALQLQTDTWRRMVLAGVLEAAKVLYDELVWNVDLTEAFPDWNLADINELEATFCQFLQFSFHVRSSTYAKYYFAVTSLPHLAGRERPGLAVPPSPKLSARNAAMQDAVSEGMGLRIELKTLARDSNVLPSSGRSSYRPVEAHNLVPEKQQDTLQAPSTPGGFTRFRHRSYP